MNIDQLTAQLNDLTWTLGVFNTRGHFCDTAEIDTLIGKIKLQRDNNGVTATIPCFEEQWTEVGLEAVAITRTVRLIQESTDHWESGF